MTNAAAQQAAIAQAVKASGAIVRLDPPEFQKIINRAEAPLIVVAPGGFFGSAWLYLTSYKGLAFWTKSGEQLALPGRAEIVQAKGLWMPR